MNDAISSFSYIEDTKFGDNRYMYSLDVEGVGIFVVTCLRLENDVEDSGFRFVISSHGTFIDEEFSHMGSKGRNNDIYDTLGAARAAAFYKIGVIVAFVVQNRSEEITIENYRAAKQSLFESMSRLSYTIRYNAMMENESLYMEFVDFMNNDNQLVISNKTEVIIEDDESFKSKNWGTF